MKIEYKLSDLNIINNDDMGIESFALGETSNGIVFNRVTPTTIDEQDQEFELSFTLPSTYTFDKITLESNDGLEWIKIKRTTHSGKTYTTLFEIDSNYGNKRECNIIVTAYVMISGSQIFQAFSTFTLKQKEGQLPFKFETDTVIADYMQDYDYTIPVILADYFNPQLCTVRIAGDPITMAYFDYARSKFVLMLTENETTRTRTGYVDITYQDYKHTIWVKQSPSAEFFILEKESVTLDGNILLDTFTSVRYETAKTARITNITSNANWFDYELENKSIIIKPNESNYSNSNRIGRLTLTVTSDYAEFKNKQYYIEVTQTPLEIKGFTPNTLIFDADGNPIDKDYSILDLQGYEMYDYEWHPDTEDLPDWYSLKWSDSTLSATVRRIDKNVDDTERTFTETLVAQIITNEDGDTITRLFPITITQYPALPSNECGIWKDTYYTFHKNNHSVYNYYRLVNIDDSNKEIFRGRLFFINDTINIKINDIARNEMDYTKYPFSAEFIDNNGYVNVQLQVSVNGTDWEALQEYHFFNNYSYKEITDADYEFPLISKPILNYLDKRQYFIISFQDYYKINRRDTALDLTASGKLDSFYNTYRLSNCQNTVSFKVNEYDEIYIDFEHSTDIQKKYDVIDTCKPYCLYYLNSYGGWNWLICENDEKESDKITTYKYNKTVNNSLSSNFENTSYLKEYTESWKMNTPMLNDTQFKMLKDLFLSPIVYLHLLDEDKIIAVNITDTTWTQQTIRTNKWKPCSCSFTVENSQNKRIA